MTQKNMSLIHSHRHTYGHLLVCLGNRIPDLRMLGSTMSISIDLSAFVMTKRNLSLNHSHRLSARVVRLAIEVTTENKPNSTAVAMGENPGDRQ